MMAKIVLFFLVVFLMQHAEAEQRSLIVRGTVGGTRIFLDEPFSLTGGGSISFAVSQRVFIESQLLFSNSSDFREVIFLGNVIFDLISNERPMVPYLIAGAGIVNQRDKRIDFTSNEATLNGGIGLKAYISRRMFVSPELRFGAHAFPQITVSLGYSFR